MQAQRVANAPSVSGSLPFRGADRPPPFSPESRTTPPHDLTDQSVLGGYPHGPGSELLRDLMNASAALFAEHPVNVARRRAGKPPATHACGARAWTMGRAMRRSGPLP